MEKTTNIFKTLSVILFNNLDQCVVGKNKVSIPLNLNIIGNIFSDKRYQSDKLNKPYITIEFDDILTMSSSYYLDDMYDFGIDRVGDLQLTLSEQSFVDKIGLLYLMKCKEVSI